MLVSKYPVFEDAYYILSYYAVFISIIVGRFALLQNVSPIRFVV